MRESDCFLSSSGKLFKSSALGLVFDCSSRLWKHREKGQGGAGRKGTVSGERGRLPIPVYRVASQQVVIRAFP